MRKASRYLLTVGIITFLLGVIYMGSAFPRLAMECPDHEPLPECEDERSDWQTGKRLLAAGFTLLVGGTTLRLFRTAARGL